jgi:hypothetical protein
VILIKIRRGPRAYLVHTLIVARALLYWKTPSPKGRPQHREALRLDFSQEKSSYIQLFAETLLTAFWLNGVLIVFFFFSRDRHSVQKFHKKCFCKGTRPQKRPPINYLSPVLNFANISRFLFYENPTFTTPSVTCEIVF